MRPQVASGLLRDIAAAENFLAILAIKQVLHRLAPRRIRLRGALPIQSPCKVFTARLVRLWLAARRAAVGKTGLTRLQFKLLGANSTNFNRKRHHSFMIKPRRRSIQIPAPPGSGLI